MKPWEEEFDTDIPSGGTGVAPPPPQQGWKVSQADQQQRDRAALVIKNWEAAANPNDLNAQRDAAITRSKLGNSLKPWEEDYEQPAQPAQQSQQSQPYKQQPLAATMRQQTAEGGIANAFNTGIANAATRLAAGVSSILPEGAPLKRWLPTQRDVDLLEAGSEGSIPARAGQLTMDVVASAPVAFKVFKGLNAARGLAPAIAGETAVNAGYGALTADQGNAAEGAAWGAGGTLAGHSVLPLTRGLGNVAAHTLGMTTGAGDEAIRQAFKGGPGFVENMRGQVEPAVVVEQARAGIQQMRQNMQQAYRDSKPLWAMGQRLLDMTPVMSEYMKLVGSQSHQGFSKMGPAEQRVIQEIDDVLLHFRDNPALHTTEGFDALKQRLQAIYPESPQMRQAQRAVSTMANAVRQTIIDQNPAYAQAMKAYHGAASQLDEIERTLSLGDRATIDTALRKLQSLVRNNVNTNFGQRVSNANVLAQQGGAVVIPAVAGQALNSWTPRGITRAIAGGAGGFGALSGALTLPQVIAGAAAGSPRIVGEVARGVGIPFRNEYAQAAARALRRGVAPAAVELGND